MDEDSVAWDDSYSVGFTLIDDQHKELVIMTNELFQACRQGSTSADVAFMRTLQKAIEYAQTHFFTEEKYMTETDYPDLDTHKKEHDEFVGEIVKVVKEFEAGKAEPIELAKYLKSWLLNHIAISDKKYAPYLTKL